MCARAAVLIAAGMDYAVPELPGVAERWGDAVFHCPFCHGWEVRDGRLALLADGDHAVIAGLLLRGWSDDVTLLGRVDDAGRAKLEAAGVHIDERPVAAVTGDRATVVFEDGGELELDGLMVHAPLRQRSTLAAGLGLELDGAGAITVDRFFRTSLPGVFAAGDVAGTVAQVSAAIGAGATAAGAHPPGSAGGGARPGPAGQTGFRGARGSRTLNTVSPGRELSRRSPAWRSRTIRIVVSRPRPVPEPTGLVV